MEWYRGRSRTLLLGLWTVAMAGGLSGCVGLSEKVAQDEAARQLGRFGEVTVVEGEIALFRECLKKRGGTCSGDATTPTPLKAIPAGLCAGLTERVDGLPEGHPARTAKGALEHPLFGKLAAVHDHLRGLDTGAAPGVRVENSQQGSTVTVNTHLPEIRGFADQVHRATAAGGWQSLSAHAAEYEGSLAANHPQKEGAGRDRRTLAFVEAYLSAYFDQGQFVQVDLETGRVQGEVDRYLARELPWLCGGGASGEDGPGKDGNARCDNLVQKVTDEILKGAAPGSSGQDFQLLTLGSGGFVSRDNRSYRFPGFQVTLDPGGAGAVKLQQLDYTAIGSDLVAVFLEAVFDSHEGLPAVPNATGVHLSKGHEADALKVFDASTGKVDTADFTRIAQISSRADAAVGSVVDRAIQGIGPLSLNNKALEQLVTVAVSTTVHKVVAKAAWCWYSCGLDEDLKKEEERIGQEAKDKLYEGAQWVKLRLRIGGS